MAPADLSPALALLREAADELKALYDYDGRLNRELEKRIRDFLGERGPSVQGAR